MGIEFMRQFNVVYIIDWCPSIILILAKSRSHKIYLSLTQLVRDEDVRAKTSTIKKNKPMGDIVKFTKGQSDVTMIVGREERGSIGMPL